MIQAPDSDVVAEVLFDEPAGVNPQDSIGHLSDLVGDPAATTPLAVPTVVTGLWGRARQFGTNKGLLATGLTPSVAIFGRELTIEAVMATAAAQSGGNATRLIAQLGKDHTFSAAEMMQFQFLLVISGATLTLKMGWDVSGGTTVYDTGVAIPARFLALPWIHIAVVRRWYSTSDARLEYYVQGELIGSETGLSADIPSASAPTFAVGCRPATALAYDDFFVDPIDQLRISARARSAEEIRQRYLDLFVRQPLVYAALQALLPEDVYSKDPTSRIQLELQVEATLLAVALGLAAELDEDFLPDRATRALSRWEDVLKIPPAPTDDIATRRTRVLAFLRQRHGFTRAEIVKALAAPLGLTEGQVELIERSNRIDDDLTGGTLPGYYTVEGGGTQDMISKLNLHWGNGSDVRMTTGAIHGERVRVTMLEQKNGEVKAKLSQISLAVNGDGGGLIIKRAGYDEYLILGVQRVSGATHLFSRSIDGSGTNDTDFGAAPATPIYLRMLENGSGSWTLWYSSTGWEGSWTQVGGTIPFTAAWAGMVAFTNGSSSSSGGLGFSRFGVWCPTTREVFRWFVYVDPGISPSPDLKGAQILADRIAPAHTKGTVIQSKDFLCNDPYSLCDRDILGV